MSTKHVRYVITQDEATWLRNYYAVEVDPDADDPENDAQDALFNGDYDWLGFDVGDNFEYADKPIVSIERTDDLPFVTRPAEPPDPAQVVALAKAAQMAYGWMAGITTNDNGPTLAECKAALSEALRPFPAKEIAS